MRRIESRRASGSSDRAVVSERTVPMSIVKGEEVLGSVSAMVVDLVVAIVDVLLG
jgi:hypothetical protein